VGYSIGNSAKLPLVLKEFRLRSFSIFDVSVCSKPPDDVAFPVELWNDTYQGTNVLSSYRRMRVSSSPGLGASSKARHHERS